jgi:hypothetical protein
VGEAIRRDRVRVSYAAPLSDARERGEFRAFLPLKDVSSTRGIINAPCEVNDDRTNLLPGAFNEALLDVVAELVVEALPEVESVSASWELAPREIAERIEITPPRAEARVGGAACAGQWWKVLGCSSCGMGDWRPSSQSMAVRTSRRNSSAMSWLKPLRTTTRRTARSSRLGGIV